MDEFHKYKHSSDSSRQRRAAWTFICRPLTACNRLIWSPLWMHGVRLGQAKHGEEDIGSDRIFLPAQRRPVPVTVR